MSENNPFPNENNTGHIWDDSLRELLNDPPNWWRIGFHTSWILVILYTLWYPSWPGIDTHFKGLAGWTSIGEYKADLKEIDDIRAVYEDQLVGKSAGDIMKNAELTNYVVKSAKVLFGDNCAACHGTGGAGNPGYPVLADDDWLYGGNIETIVQTVTNGRQGNMPPMGLSDAEVDELATAIHSGKPTSSALFMTKGCAGCHGPDAKGMAVLGSANLTDSIWRFAEKDQLASIKHTVAHGVNNTAVDPKSRNAVMPAFGGTKLSETDIKKLAIYVHKLGGGQ